MPGQRKTILNIEHLYTNRTKSKIQITVIVGKLELTLNKTTKLVQVHSEKHCDLLNQNSHLGCDYSMN